ncbi:MAG: CoA pyrophosphatase [Saprospiraceae bacterium]|nr:CoA pyrophosphatase [Saprospiraceae bacterium]
MKEFVDHLRRRLSEPLPGRAAQYKMASMRRLEELGALAVVPPDAKVACVLNLLHWHQDAWRTVLIQRTQNPRDRHGGQVSFPGGRWEDADGVLANVALREAEEEIGVPASQIEILGSLTDLYIPVSNFLVHPFVGILQAPPLFTPQPGEVESILTPPVQYFLAPENRKITDLTLAQGLTIKEVPYFEVEGRMVWGATAMILSEFLELLG